MNCELESKWDECLNFESCLDDALGDEPQAPGPEGHRVEGDAGDELDEGGDRVHRQRVDQLALRELKWIDYMIGNLDNPNLMEPVGCVSPVPLTSSECG